MLTIALIIFFSKTDRSRCEESDLLAGLAIVRRCQLNVVQAEKKKKKKRG